MKTIQEEKEALIRYCIEQISFYHEGNRRSELNPTLWLERIDQINKGKVLDADTKIWLSCMAISFTKNPEFSQWLNELAQTYKYIACPYCAHPLSATAKRNRQCSECLNYLIETEDGSIRLPKYKDD